MGYLRTQLIRIAVCTTLWCAVPAFVSAAEEITARIVRIAGGESWANPLWGTNAYKLVHDGNHFFSIGHWGASQAVTRGTVYRLEEEGWVPGYQWDDLNYQPGMLLLDSQMRLLVLYPKMWAKPVILRAVQPGEFREFENLTVPEWLAPAGYIGAGIHDDVIVMGYIGAPGLYSFNIAIFDMKTSTWTGPFMLAEGQRVVEPFTTWRYPIIHPDEGGFHLALSNGRDATSFKHQVLYMRLPYEIELPVEPEIVAQTIPWTNRMAQAGSMFVAADETIFIAGQYQPVNNMFAIWRRSTEGVWDQQLLSTSQVGAAFQNPADPQMLWLMSSFGTTLRLYQSQDDGASWQVRGFNSLAEYGLSSTFELHGVFPASGSVMPSSPTAIFQSGRSPNYSIWFVQFDIPDPVRQTSHLTVH